MDEIIAILILVAAAATIPPIFICDRHFGYMQCLQGWCILLAIIICVCAAVTGVWLAFGVLFTTN